MLHKRWIKRIAATALLIVLLTGGVLGLCRNRLLHAVADKRIERIEHRYDLKINYSELRMKGVSSLILKGFSIVPNQRDTLLAVQNLELQLNPWSLLVGNINIRDLHMDSLMLNFTKCDSIANYDFLFRPTASDAEPEAPKQRSVNYSRNVNALLRLLFGLLPGDGDLRHIRLSERKDDHFLHVEIDTLRIDHHRFSTQIDICEDHRTQQWIAVGELNPKEHRIETTLRTQSGQPLTLPYLQRRFEAEVAFDSLICSFSQQTSTNGALQLAGKSEICGLHLYHKRLSAEVINLDHGLLDFYLNIMPRSIELDSISQIRFNTLDFHPYLRFERLKNAKKGKEWHITAAVHKPWFDSEELFGSLPKGLFENLEGIRTSGQLAYDFLLDIDFEHLDSLKLESDLRTKNFRIINFGRTYLGKMSGEFSYTAYENGQPMRTFPVGASWEHFTPLDSISPLLRMSVMQSEDGAFFEHRGFLPFAIREALIYDLKVNRFARGGSTISMQLVKNVFLNRNKNIARKLEEALIVWLIESQHLTSKARMYEVYLNIAEWAPMVYGIGEAAQFYFDKRPSQLSAAESIFLASIIPKPKHFRSLFTDEGRLKENQAGYFRLIARRLVQKGLISEEQAETISIEQVVLNGAAKAYFMPTSIPE